MTPEINESKNPSIRFSKKWRDFRFIVHLTAFLIFFAPNYLPLSFAPEFLHDIFGAQNGALVIVLTFLLYVVFLFSLILWCIHVSLSNRHFYENLFFEAIGIPLLLITIAVTLNAFAGNTAERIVAINQGRSPAEFENPFLAYKMLTAAI